MLSIGSSQCDAFARYTMPRLTVKYEGTKTLLCNLPEICKSLDRHPIYVTKFIAYELGTQTQVDTKHRKYIVCGHHDVSCLQKIILRFVDLFVICTCCSNPETCLVVKKRSVFRNCKACGDCHPLDMKLQLCNFIAKKRLSQFVSLGWP